MVKCLEGLGGDASVSFLSRQQYEDVVGGFALPQEQQAALLDRDVQRISDLLGGRARMVCAIYAPEESPLKERENEDGPENGEERPDEDAQLN
jgi:hypothetical protein